MPTAPPLPQLDATWAWPAAGLTVGVGVLLLVWGSKYHRGALALVGAAAGVLFGPVLAARVALSPLAGRIAAPMVLAIVAVVGAQVVWAILGTAILLGAAAWTLACMFVSGPAAGEAAGATDLTDWCTGLWTFVSARLTEAWSAHALTIVLTLFVAGAVPLIVGLFKPKVATVVMTALLGAGGIVVGGLLGAAQINADWWGEAMKHYGIPVAVLIVLMTFGVAWQYRYELAELRRGDTDDDEAPSGEGKSTRAKGRRTTGKGSR